MVKSKRQSTSGNGFDVGFDVSLKQSTLAGQESGNLYIRPAQSQQSKGKGSFKGNNNNNGSIAKPTIQSTLPFNFQAPFLSPRKKRRLELEEKRKGMKKRKLNSSTLDRSNQEPSSSSNGTSNAIASTSKLAEGGKRSRGIGAQMINPTQIEKGIRIEFESGSDAENDARGEDAMSKKRRRGEMSPLNRYHPRGLEMVADFDGFASETSGHEKQIGFKSNSKRYRRSLEMGAVDDVAVKSNRRIDRREEEEEEEEEEENNIVIPPTPPSHSPFILCANSDDEDSNVEEEVSAQLMGRGRTRRGDRGYDDSGFAEGTSSAAEDDEASLSAQLVLKRLLPRDINRFILAEETAGSPEAEEEEEEEEELELQDSQLSHSAILPGSLGLALSGSAQLPLPLPSPSPSPSAPSPSQSAFILVPETQIDSAVTSSFHRAAFVDDDDFAFCIPATQHSVASGSTSALVRSASTVLMPPPPNRKLSSTSIARPTILVYETQEADTVDDSHLDSNGEEQDEEEDESGGSPFCVEETQYPTQPQPQFRSSQRPTSFPLASSSTRRIISPFEEVNKAWVGQIVLPRQTQITAFFPGTTEEGNDDDDDDMVLEDSQPAMADLTQYQLGAFRETIRINKEKGRMEPVVERSQEEEEEIDELDELEDEPVVAEVKQETSASLRSSRREEEEEAEEEGMIYDREDVIPTSDSEDCMIPIDQDPCCIAKLEARLARQAIASLSPRVNNRRQRSQRTPSIPSSPLSEAANLPLSPPVVKSSFIGDAASAGEIRPEAEEEVDQLLSLPDSSQLPDSLLTYLKHFEEHGICTEDSLAMSF